MESIVVDHGSLQNFLSNCIWSRIGTIDRGGSTIMSLLSYYGSTQAIGGIHGGNRQVLEAIE